MSKSWFGKLIDCVTGDGDPADDGSPEYAEDKHRGHQTAESRDEAAERLRQRLEDN